jgi:hypothetical protein
MKVAIRNLYYRHQLLTALLPPVRLDFKTVGPCGPARSYSSLDVFRQVLLYHGSVGRTCVNNGLFLRKK